MPPWLVLIVKGTKAPAQYETPALAGGEGCEMKRMHENHRVRMAAIALVAAMTLGPAAAMAAPCAAPAGQGACAGACAATAASAGCLYVQACPADDAQVDCPRAGARAAWLEGACNALRCRSARAAQVAGDWTAQRRGAFVDADGDGVCDNAQNCARANGDCPGLGAGAGNAAGNAAGNGNGYGYGAGSGDGNGMGASCGYGAGCAYCPGADCTVGNGAGSGCGIGNGAGAGSGFGVGADNGTGVGCGVGARTDNGAGCTGGFGQGAHHGWGGGRR